MIFHHNKPHVRFAGWAYLCLLALFSVIATNRPVVGFAGLGTVMVLAAIMVEANHQVIWENYQKEYKKAKRKGVASPLSAPSELYYKLNVYAVWPAVLVIGLLTIGSAYLIAS